MKKCSFILPNGTQCGQEIETNIGLCSYHLMYAKYMGISEIELIEKLKGKSTTVE